MWKTSKEINNNNNNNHGSISEEKVHYEELIVYKNLPMYPKIFNPLPNCLFSAFKLQPPTLC